MPWSVLKPAFLDKFEQGQHIAVIGPTGKGKTTLAVDLLDTFHGEGMSELVIANKPRDDLLTELERDRGWVKITRWPPDEIANGQVVSGPGENVRVQGRRIILWPPYGRSSQAKRNAHIFEEAMDYALLEGGWCVYVDETRYLVEQLGLRRVVDEYWNGARSSRVTLIAGSQGTTWINKTMIRQETWLFLFKPNSVDEAKEFADAAGDPDLYHALIGMAHHDFMIVHMPQMDERYISRVGT